MYGKRVVQIAAMDLNGTFVTLSNTGSIQCLGTSSLEVLWSIASDHFRFKPEKLWCDKLGCNFVVYCKAVEGSSLELWMPPESYNMCMTGDFSR